MDVAVKQVSVAVPRQLSPAPTFAPSIKPRSLPNPYPVLNCCDTFDTFCVAHLAAPAKGVLSPRSVQRKMVISRSQTSYILTTKACVPDVFCTCVHTSAHTCAYKCAYIHTSVHTSQARTVPVHSTLTHTHIHTGLMDTPHIDPRPLHYQKHAQDLCTAHSRIHITTQA